jgi:hypothetical protein
VMPMTSSCFELRRERSGGQQTDGHISAGTMGAPPIHYGIKLTTWALTLPFLPMRVEDVHMFLLPVSPT